MANTLAAEVRSCASTRMPLSQAMPAASARSLLAMAPAPTITRSAGHSPPSPRTAITWPSRPAKPVTRAFSSMAMPLARCRAVTCSETTGATARSMIRAAVSSTVTCLPSWRAVEAISRPMKPPPTTTTDRQACSLRRMRRASPRVRRVSMPSRSQPGSARVRARAPVASTRWSYSRRSPLSSSTALPTTSMLRTRVLRRRSMRCSV
ncbi:hypothetical protein D3C78_827390 [compost metagenome]